MMSMPLHSRACLLARGRRLLGALFMVLAAGVGLPAQAGRSCEQRPINAESLQKGLNLAEKVSQSLDASGARVVVLARMGQDLSKYQLRYSHLGYAYKSAEGPWRVLHKLNQCGTAVSHIERQGLGEFFMDDLWRFEAAWVVPTPAVQDALYPVLQDKARIAPLFEPAYSMVSYAWGQTYQQSNQWALELLAGALEPQIHNRQQAQAWLKFKGYEPTALNIGPLTRLGGRITAANIAFDDHPNEKRFSDRIETVTVDSMFAWLQRAQLGSAPQVLRLPAP